MSEVETLLKQFQSVAIGAQPNVKEGQSILSKLKISLLKYQLLPPFTSSPDVVCKQLLEARETYELGALLSVSAKDTASFERHVSILKPYYTDYSALLAKTPSSRRLPIMGLYFSFLLSQSRLSEVHTELELLSDKDRDDVNIRFPLDMERSLMEGSYHKVLSARANMPMPQYTALFMDILDETVRDSIAACTEKAYETFPVKEAAQLLLLEPGSEKLRALIEKRKWVAKDGNFIFSDHLQVNQDLPAHNTIRQTLGYACELERIV